MCAPSRAARECTTLTYNRYCTHCLRNDASTSGSVETNPASCVDNFGTACWTSYKDSEVAVPLCSSLHASAPAVGEDCYSSITVGGKVAPLAYTQRDKLSSAPSCPTGKKFPF